MIPGCCQIDQNYSTTTHVDSVGVSIMDVTAFGLDLNLVVVDGDVEILGFNTRQISVNFVVAGVLFVNIHCI